MNEWLLFFFGCVCVTAALTLLIKDDRPPGPHTQYHRQVIASGQRARTLAERYEHARRREATRLFLARRASHRARKVRP